MAFSSFVFKFATFVTKTGLNYHKNGKIWLNNVLSFFFLINDAWNELKSNKSITTNKATVVYQKNKPPLSLVSISAITSSGNLLGILRVYNNFLHPVS